MLFKVAVVIAAYLLSLCVSIDVTCDIVIGGGNTAALSAGIYHQHMHLNIFCLNIIQHKAITVAEAAAKSNKIIRVCLLEPTDWPGGQLTAQGVSAIDYGSYNNYSANWPDSWKALAKIIAPDNKNVGVCWVSQTCYQPQILMDQYIRPVLKNYSQYITVYDRTVIIDTISNTDNNGKKYIEAVIAIQRKPVDPNKEWSYLFSEQLEDWYSPNNSKLFTKTQYRFNGKVFIDATELGDILMTSGIKDIFQGAESPNETSTTTLDQCGQAVTFTFFMELLSSIPENPPIVPPGNPEGEAYGYQNNDWNQVWTYRRSYDANGPDSGLNNTIHVGDITQQNWGLGNDYDTGYAFLPVEMAKKQNPWKGGLNMTAISEAEQRAYGFYHYYVNTSYENNSTTKFDPRQLIMQINITNTSIGLSRYPYWRDVKRTYGLFGFRLNHSTALPIYNETSKSGNYSVGYRFKDTIAIGNYAFDMHILTNECKDEYPDYVKSGHQENVPYFVPFRAIGNNVYKNLLFAGKNIAQSFYVNAATRLHPSEWTIGVGAGGAAFYMIDNGIDDTAIVYDQIEKLQELLKSIGQPLDWN